MGAFLFIGISHSSAQYFVKSVGNDDDIESATAVISDGKGNILVSGYRNNQAVLLKMTPYGSILWQHEFKIAASSKRDIIYDMEVDGDFVVCVGYGDATSGLDDDAFVFRYDHVNEVMDWTMLDNNSMITRFYTVTINSGNYVITGANYPQSSATEGLIFTIDNSGAGINWLFHYSTGGFSDDLTYAETNGTDLIVGGRVFSGSGSLCKSRAMMSSMKILSGIDNWSNTYFANSSENIRMYSQDLTIDGNHIVLAANGNYNNNSSCNGNTYNTYLAKTDLNGLLQTDRVIAISGYNSLVPREVYPLNGGYVVMGQATEGASGIVDFFLMQVDANLQPVWTQVLGGPKNDNFGVNANNQMYVDVTEGAIYFVGQTLNYTTSSYTDMVIYKTDLTGVISSDCGQEEEPLHGPGPDKENDFSWTKTIQITQHTDVTPDITPGAIPCDVVCGCILPEPATLGGGDPKSIRSEKSLEDQFEERPELALEVIELKEGFEVYPNPVDDVLELNILESSLRIDRILITNIAGAEVLNRPATKGTLGSIDVSSLENGTYLITLTADDGQEYTQQFIKKN